MSIVRGVNKYMNICWLFELLGNVYLNYVYENGY